jgi:hypothetical protein
LNGANWKADSSFNYRKKNSRSSFNIESSGRSNEDFDLNYHTAQHRRVKPEVLDMGSRNRKEEAENTDRHFVQKTSGMSNEQLKGFAVVGLTRE